MPARPESAARAGAAPTGPPALRLLLVSQHFWPESFRINSFAETLVKAGAQVTVLTGQPNYPEGRVFAGYRALSLARETQPTGIEIVRVPLIPRGRAGHLRLAANYLSYIVSAGVLGPALLRRRRFDAILVYGTSPIFQALAAWPLRAFKRAMAGHGIGHGLGAFGGQQLAPRLFGFGDLAHDEQPSRHVNGGGLLKTRFYRLASL
ncbi:MAG: hypothetical protein ACEQR8_03810, partial [Cypionkella sp.]